MYYVKRFLVSASIPVEIHTKKGKTHASISFVLRSAHMCRPVNPLPFLESDNIITKQEGLELIGAFKEKNKVFLREIKYNVPVPPIRLLREITKSAHKKTLKE